MTKKVRIENADTSDYKVLIQVWEKQGEGQDAVMVTEHQPLHPTALQEVTLWRGRYLVVKVA